MIIEMLKFLCYDLRITTWNHLLQTNATTQILKHEQWLLFSFLAYVKRKGKNIIDMNSATNRFVNKLNFMIKKLKNLLDLKELSQFMIILGHS